MLLLGVFLRVGPDSPGGWVYCKVRAMETGDQDVGWAWLQLDCCSSCSGVWKPHVWMLWDSDGKRFEKKNDTNGSCCTFAFLKREMSCGIKVLAVDSVDLLSLSLQSYSYIIWYLITSISKWKTHHGRNEYVVLNWEFLVVVAHDHDERNLVLTDIADFIVSCSILQLRMGQSTRET
jgi:hypothetical protein